MTPTPNHPFYPITPTPAQAYVMADLRKAFAGLYDKLKQVHSEHDGPSWSLNCAAPHIDWALQHLVEASHHAMRAVLTSHIPESVLPMVPNRSLRVGEEAVQIATGGRDDTAIRYRLNEIMGRLPHEVQGKLKDIFGTANPDSSAGRAAQDIVDRERPLVRRAIDGNEDIGPELAKHPGIFGRLPSTLQPQPVRGLDEIADAPFTDHNG